MLTIRQQLIALLSQREYGVRDLSQMLGIPEKEVYPHLSHIARSVASKKRRLKIEPARCYECGFLFEERKRFTKPSRCPRCRGERIEAPRYKVV
ncbi:MAG: transcriptional regulator [Deltaproteobacteria bacterium]|nr:transcriptional regulator [Deltaproteobacteria bacterium]